VPRLCGHTPEPCLSIHPADAALFGLQDDGIAHLESPRGAALLRVRVDPGQRRGEVFAPMHWNDQFAAQSAIDRLVAPVTDPISGQPELKHTPVRARAATIAWEAMLLTREPVTSWEDGVFWVRIAGLGHTAYRLAGSATIDNWRVWLHRHVEASDWMEYEDRGLGIYRAALMRDRRLDAALFVGPAGRRPTTDWLAERFTQAGEDDPDPAALLLGGKSPDRGATGPIVCSCYVVRQPAISAAIAEKGLASIEEIGQALRAGTNCGSCIPELRRLVRQAAAPARPDTHPKVQR